MTETTTGVRAMLSRPAVYDVWSRAVGGKRAQTILVHDYIRPWPKARILDLGCGTGELLRYLGDVSYMGVDISSDYISRARASFDGAEFEVGDATTFQAPAGEFDLVLAVGVLHHLDEARATSLFKRGAAALRPLGRMITVDPTFATGQSRAARFVIARDRGKDVRTPDAYSALAAVSFGSVRAVVRSDLIRIPYTHCLLECKSPTADGA